MEFFHYFPSVTFVVMTVDQSVGRDDGPLEQQKQDSHVCRRNRTFPLILRKNQSHHYKDDEIDLRTVKEPSSETLLRLAELVLTLNCFSFADHYYKQINGVAMGTKMGPSYANLFVGYIEHQFFNQYNGPKPELYRRYIDDCIGATSSTREDLNQFITAVNSFHPALKYTWEISDTSLAFLDIKVSIEGNGLCTSVHYKPTDSHSYLLYSSPHPSHVRNSIPYSQFLRLRRLCSDDSARARCKTCPFIHNVEKISRPKRSITITDHFTCTSANVIYCITCTFCKKLYIGETGRRLGDRFREHLRDVEKDENNAFKPIARHFNLPNHSKQHMAVCGLSLHQGSTESRKTLEQKFIFQIGSLNPHGINERFSFN